MTMPHSVQLMKEFFGWSMKATSGAAFNTPTSCCCHHSSGSWDVTSLSRQRA